MSWPDDKMLGFDLETTGTDPLTAAPVAFALVQFHFGQPGQVRAALVNPGIPIPPEATKVHGITDADVEQRGGDLARSVKGIFEYLMDASVKGIPLVGMNLRYDLTVIDTWLKDVQEEGLRGSGWDGMVLDALVLDRYVDRYRKGKRNLSALCESYGVEHGGAHDAVADVIASYSVVRSIAVTRPALAESSIEELHTQQQLAHKEWAEHFTEYRVKKGEAPLEESEFGWPLPFDEPPAGDLIEVPHETDESLLVSQGQVTSLQMRFKEVYGTDDRQERLWILTQIVGRDVTTTRGLTESEYREAVAYMDLQKDTSGPKILLASAREAIAERMIESPPFENPDVGDADGNIVRSTMKKVMHMTSAEVTPLLKQYSLSTAGKINDKRLRFYEFACRERAKHNAEVEALFDA